jgi:hypothetical protein
LLVSASYATSRETIAGFVRLRERQFPNLAGGLDRGKSLSRSSVTHCSAQSTRNARAVVAIGGRVNRPAQADVTPAALPFGQSENYGMQFGAVRNGNALSAGRIHTLFVRRKPRRNPLLQHEPVVETHLAARLLTPLKPLRERLGIMMLVVIANADRRYMPENKDISRNHLPLATSNRVPVQVLAVCGSMFVEDRNRLEVDRARRDQSVLVPHCCGQPSRQLPVRTRDRGRGVLAGGRSKANATSGSLSAAQAASKSRESLPAVKGSQSGNRWAIARRMRRNRSAISANASSTASDGIGGIRRRGSRRTYSKDRTRSMGWAGTPARSASSSPAVSSSARRP